MSHIRSVNTKPEVALRCALWRRGFRYRVNVKELPGSPDIVLPKHRTVVFVHGCFWHAHKGCKIYHLPKTNTDFWQAKVTRNQERDQDVWRQLEARGWSVVIVWECELAKAKIEDTVERVSTEITNNGNLFRARELERQSARVLRIEEIRESRERKKALIEEIRGKRIRH